MNSKTASLPFKGALLGAVLALSFSAGVQAQTNSTGNIAGHATAGDIVVITNPKTGFERQLTVNEKGHYRMNALPLGSYVVTIKHADGTVFVSKPTRVQMGRTSNIKQD